MIKSNLVIARLFGSVHSHPVSYTICAMYKYMHSKKKKQLVVILVMSY